MMTTSGFNAAICRHMLAMYSSSIFSSNSLQCSCHTSAHTHTHAHTCTNAHAHGRIMSQANREMEERAQGRFTSQGAQHSRLPLHQQVQSRKQMDLTANITKLAVSSPHDNAGKLRQSADKQRAHFGIMRASSPSSSLIHGIHVCLALTSPLPS